jgi:hypothetical protein
LSLTSKGRVSVYIQWFMHFVLLSSKVYCWKTLILLNQLALAKRTA